MQGFGKKLTRRETAAAARSSVFARGPGDQREGVNTLPRQRAEGIINEPMAGQARQPGEAGAVDLHAEMPAFAGSRMAGMLVAVVVDHQVIGSQHLAQARCELIGGHGGRHRRVSPLSTGAKSMAAELMQ